MVFSWFIFLISLSICLIIKALLSLLSTQPKYPPGPTNIPIFSTLHFVRRGFVELEPFLRQLFSKYGPVVLLQNSSQKFIFITSPELIHKTLVIHGSTFADRPQAPVASRYLSCNQHNIGSAAYGPLWRLLRRNLTSEMLHPSRIKSFTQARKWVLNILNRKLKQESNSGTKFVCVKNHFQYAMFCLLVYMCFGDKLDDVVVKQIEQVQREFLLSLSKFNVLDSMPKLGKILFRYRWNLLYKIRSKQISILLPLIRAREETKNKGGVVAYVDTLLNLSLPEEGGRKLNEHEMVNLCAEFLNAGTDTTAIALEWIMANLVKHQDIQAKLFEEIKANSEQGAVREEDLQKMPYLKAVVLEGLRRHPPAHFVLPHSVTEETQLEGYIIPKDASINFTVAEIGWDPNVWEEPMQFRPERFLSNGNGEAFDITGSKEIKMIPFGAGRRICPAFGLAILQLEYFVANLIKEFEWTAGKGDDVNLSEKPEFTTVMKNPLRAHISAR